MKKTIAILLVLVIGMVGVFAADPSPATASLQLQTSVGLIFQTKLVATTNKLTPVNVTNFDAASTLLTEQIVDTLTRDFGYLYIKSNNKPGYDLDITGSPLTSGSLDTDINYILTATAGSDSAKLDTLTTANNTKYTSSVFAALDVTEFVVSVVLNETDFAAALVGDYTADVIFSFTTNS